jgi:hypothetical protein
MFLVDIPSSLAHQKEKVALHFSKKKNNDYGKTYAQLQYFIYLCKIHN